MIIGEFSLTELNTLHDAMLMFSLRDNTRSVKQKKHEQALLERISDKIYENERSMRHMKVRLDWNGATVEGYDLPSRFKVGDSVCIQAQFSIMSDKYMIQSIRKAPVKRRHPKLVAA